MKYLERERAMLVSKDEYPQNMPCAVCGYRWMQHKGLICPETPGYLFPLDMGDRIEMVPVMPTFGNSLFIPDVAFEKEPDFEVV